MQTGRSVAAELGEAARVAAQAVACNASVPTSSARPRGPRCGWAGGCDTPLNAGLCSDGTRWCGGLALALPFGTFIGTFRPMVYGAAVDDRAGGVVETKLPVMAVQGESGLPKFANGQIMLSTRGARNLSDIRRSSPPVVSGPAYPWQTHVIRSHFPLCSGNRRRARVARR